MGSKDISKRTAICVSLTALLSMAATVAGISAAQGPRQDQPSRISPPSEKVEARKSTGPRLFESVSGYLEGMHRKGNKDPKPEASAQQRRRLQTVPSPDLRPKLAMETEEQISRTRMERQEWDLAAESLQRALKTVSSTNSGEEASRLDMLLKAARDHGTQTVPEQGEIVNSVGMKLVVIPAGSFTMGSTLAETRRLQNDWSVAESLVQPEEPAHAVRISRNFLLGKYGVTVRQFKQFVAETGYRTVAERHGWGWVFDAEKRHWVKKNGTSWRNPGAETWDDHPVTMVCHEDAEAFCRWLTKKEGRLYHLPTEAQWEYAARGGKEGERFPWGEEYPDGKKLNMADKSSPVPWADKTVDDRFGRTSPVGAFAPNGYWLYDMVGNVWQFCSDYYDSKAYEGTKNHVTVDPVGPAKGKKRVVRGGNWAFEAGIARSSFRFGIDADLCVDVNGFRVAAVAEPGENPLDQKALPAAGERQFTNEQITELMARVKKLVAEGRRLEARKIVDQLGQTISAKKGAAEGGTVSVRNALEDVIDVTQDSSVQSFTNSLSMKMVRISAGAFGMGSSESDISWALTTLAQGQPMNLENEFPLHKVRVSRPFFISATEVTVGWFRTFVEETGYVTDAEDAGGGEVFSTRDNRFEKKTGTSWRNPGWAIKDDEPVVMVSWYDAQAFVEWLTAKEKLSYKLPTEAQWEYAARGGIPMAQFPWGDTLPDGRRANYADRNTDYEWRDRTADDGHKYVAPVGSYDPNGYGLYDMAGNVLEWVRDYYGEDYYRFSPEVDPEGPGQGENRVSKGGEWTFGPVNLRCAFRGWSRPDAAFFNTGFRVVAETGLMRTFHFANDFLTKEWVPGSEQREVAMAVAKEKELQAVTTQPDQRATPKAGSTETAEPPSLKGIVIVDFRTRSAGQKAGLRKGDIIIEYHGVSDLTVERFKVLTIETKREKAKPVVIFVRDGVEYSVQVPPGSLGITIADTETGESIKRTDPAPQVPPQEDKKKGTKHKDWT